MPSENTIYFYPGRGGHSHNGNDSSFIDTSVYSLFDFSWGEVGDPDRVASQRINYNAFRDFIITTVNESILEPSGLVLQPDMVNGTAHIISRSIEANTIAANTLTANEIAANTITSNEIAANFVLVNTIIASSDFNGTFNPTTFALSNTGTDGWAITSAGDAVFTNGLFRGNLLVGANDYWYSNGAFALGGNTGIYRNVGEGITLGANVTILGGVVASSVATPGIDIDANGNLTSNASTFGIYANGAIFTSSGNFGVDAGGNLYAENAIIYGEIYANTGTIAGDIISGGTISGVEMVVTESGIETSINVPYIFGGDAYTFIVKEVATPLNAVRIAPGKLFVTSPTQGISLDMTNGIFSTLGITTTGELQCDYGNITGSGIIYQASNILGGFPIAFGYSNGTGQLNALVDNNLSFYLTKTSSSDRRLKHNIEPISSAVLDKFYSIKTYEFDWNDKAPQYLQNIGRSVGVVADELKDLYPSAVIDFGAYEGWVHRYDEHPEGFSLEEMEKFGSDYYEFVPGEGVWQKPRYASVDYTVLIPHLISAIHDLNNRVKELESKV